MGTAYIEQENDMKRLQVWRKGNILFTVVTTISQRKLSIQCWQHEVIDIYPITFFLQKGVVGHLSVNMAQDRIYWGHWPSEIAQCPTQLTQSASTAWRAVIGVDPDQEQVPLKALNGN